jgi:hypothetical protein
VATNQPAFYAFAVAAIGLVGAIILIAMSKTVPDAYWAVTGGTAVGGLGALTPGRI